MTDDELIEAMWRAYIGGRRFSMPNGIPAAMRQVLAVVRAHDRDGELLDWLEQNPRHENVPYFDESEGSWGFPYAISNANGLGGGVGFHRFDSLRAAIRAAMRAEG